MTESTTSTPEASTNTTELGSKLRSSSEKNQLQLLQQITEGSFDVLMEFLLERKSLPPTVVDGKIYQILYSANSSKATEFLQTHFPTGIVTLRSQSGMDYSLLQQLLAKQDFQEADQLTLEKLCELAGETALKRKWLYFTQVESLPAADLQTINLLWVLHSEGKFGFSVQREIWFAVGKNWDKFWPQIGWKKGNNWTRYPKEFIWDLSAPRGHLPLSNQLRGKQPFMALLSHPAWLG
jgi:hypothetical protein